MDVSGHEQTVMPSGNQWAKHSGALVSNGSGDWAPIRMNHLSISKPQTTSEVLVARLEESPKCRSGCHSFCLFKPQTLTVAHMSRHYLFLRFRYFKAVLCIEARQKAGVEEREPGNVALENQANLCPTSRTPFIRSDTISCCWSRFSNQDRIPCERRILVQ